VIVPNDATVDWRADQSAGYLYVRLTLGDRVPAGSARRAVALAAGFTFAIGITCVPALAATGRADRAPLAAKVTPTSVAAPAPSDAAKDPQLRLTDVACPSARNCWAVGTYLAKGAKHYAVLEHLVGSKWHTQRAPLPVFAASDPKMTLSVITCASVHFCVAFGTYIDATDAPQSQKQALIETYERETPTAPLTWAGSRLFATPGGATVAEIASASCSADRSCAAVGSYVSGRGVRHAQLETYTPSGWIPTDASLPLNAQGSSSLAAVDCPAKSTCFAAGSYHTDTGEHAGLLDRLDSSGNWTAGRAKDVGDSRTGDPGTELTAISCPAATFCAIGGQYMTGGKKPRQLGYLELWSDSEYSEGLAAPVPPAGRADPAMSITALSCAAAGECAATGELTDKHGHQVGALLRLVENRWHAVAAPLARAASNPHVQIADLACGQVAVGSFTQPDGHARPLLETLGANGWTGRTGPVPTGAGKPAASLAAVACDPSGRAVAVGRYVDKAGRHRGVITRNVPE
jgi:hypothetical protein